MLYEIVDKQSVPAILRNGSFGNKWRVFFNAPGVVDYDYIEVEKLEASQIDTAIKARIEEHKTVNSLGR